VALTDVFAVHVVVEAEAVHGGAGDADGVFGGHTKRGAQETSRVAVFTRSGRLDVHEET